MDEIRDFMRSPVVSIDGQATAQKGAQNMIQNKISSLIVKENDKSVGIVTHTDLVREVLAKGLDPKSTKMESIMTQPLITKDHYIPRSEAHEFMLRNKIKHLVVTKDRKIVGMLTTKDLIS